MLKKLGGLFILGEKIMPSNYKTLFIPTTEVKTKSMMKGYMRRINGDELARDVQAAILEQEQEGFHLQSTTPITSTLHNNRFFTEGVLLVFRKMSE